MSNKITIKTAKEIALMKESGRIATRVLNNIIKHVKPNITTLSLDKMAEKQILSYGAKPSFKNFNGYPASLCVSVNNEVVHGIPGRRILNNGDIVGIDLGVYFKGYHSDTAVTVGVGNISKEAQKLIDTTKLSLDRAINTIRPNIHLGDVQEVIQNLIEKEGYGVIRDLAGHGIGRSLQEPPSIPNFGKKGTGLILKEGMTIAIEPMVSMGNWQVKILKDGWTVVTADNSLSAHFEHTLAVTNKGAEVLTKE